MRFISRHQGQPRSFALSAQTLARASARRRIPCRTLAGGGSNTEGSEFASNVGASYYVTTLHEAVEACLAVVHKSAKNPKIETRTAEDSSDNLETASRDFRLRPNRTV